jgi:hypothetical protein
MTISTVQFGIASHRLPTTPVDLGRDEARELARRELADPVYDRERSLLGRAAQWIMEQIAAFLDQANGVLDSRLGVALVVAIVIAAAVVVILRTGPLARPAARWQRPLFGDERRSADDHRRAADAAARKGDWSRAVVERFRAVVAQVEERALIETRPGRTADEAARDAGAVLPDLGSELAAGAALFDAVHYGGRRAGSADDAHLRDLDRRVAGAKPGPANRDHPVLASPR